MCVFLGPVVSPAPTRVPGTEQALHTYCWREGSDSPFVNTDSESHGYKWSPNCTDMLMPPVHTHTNRHVLRHAHMLEQTPLDTQSHRYKHPRRALS